MGDLGNIPPTGVGITEAGTDFGKTSIIDWIEGAGIQIDETPDPANNRIRITITATGGGGGGAGTGEPFVTIGNTAGLTSERALTGTARVSVTDNGANTTVTLDIPLNAITNARLAQMAARTLKGNATNATADPSDIAGAGAGTTVLDSGSALAFGVLTRILQNISFEGDISPAQITADQNNYSPASLGTAFVLRLNTDAARNLTGLVPGTADGDAKLVVNVGSFDLTLVSESASSTATNRFTGGDLTIRANECALLYHDPTTDRWRTVLRSHRPLAGNGTITVTGDAIVVATGGITGNEIAAAIKDAAAGTASLRTLGTSSTSACAGNDSRLSDTRTPTDASVTEVKLATIVGHVVFGLTDAATITVNRDNGRNQKVTLGGNRTMGIPSGTLIDGMFLIFAIRQDGTGSRTITFATGTGGYRATGGCSLTPTLSTGAGKLDWVVARYDATDNKWDLVQLTLAA